MTRAYDVVVVGAGVHGASVARSLSSASAGSVLVVEDGGDAATTSSAAVVSTHYPWLPESLVATAGLAAYERMGDETGVDPWVRRCGVDHLVGSSGAAAVRARVEEQARHGVPVTVEDVASARRRWPDVDPGAAAVVVHEHRGGYVDPCRVVDAQLSAARRAGVRVVRSAVDRLVVRRGRVVGVATRDGEIAAGAVVLAAGARAAPVLRRSGLPVPFEPRRVRTATFRTDVPVRAPVLLDVSDGSWLRGDADGTVTVGLELALPDSRAWAPDAGAPDWFSRMCAARVRARLPHVGNLTHVGGRSGLVAMSADGRVVVDRVPGAEGALGFLADCGTALKMAPALGSAVAEWVVEGRPRTHDLAAFGLARSRGHGDADGYGRFGTTARLLRERAAHLRQTPVERNHHAR